MTEHFLNMHVTHSFEPADSQEALDMAKEAFYISEKADSLVALHMTTRVCHSKCVVELGEREKCTSTSLQKECSKIYSASGTFTGYGETQLSEIRRFKKSIQKIHHLIEKRSMIPRSVLYVPDVVIILQKKFW